MQSTAAGPGLHRALYRRFGEDVALADRLGFAAVWVGEHRVWYDGWCPAPLHALAYAAGLTERIHLGTAMYLVPQHEARAAAGRSRRSTSSPAAGSSSAPGSATATRSSTRSGCAATGAAG